MFYGSVSVIKPPGGGNSQGCRSIQAGSFIAFPECTWNKLICFLHLIHFFHFVLHSPLSLRALHSPHLIICVPLAEF